MAFEEMGAEVEFSGGVDYVSMFRVRAEGGSQVAVTEAKRHAVQKHGIPYGMLVARHFGLDGKDHVVGVAVVGAGDS